MRFVRIAGPFAVSKSERSRGNFCPGPKRQTNAMRTSRRMLKDVRRAWFTAFFFSAFINILMLATPLYTLQVFDTVVPLGSIETLVIITAITSLSIAALALLEICRDLILLRASVWLDHELGRHILSNRLKLAASPQDIREDCKALEQFHGFLASPAAGIVLDAPFVPLFLIGLFLLSPLIGWVALAAAGLLSAAAVLQVAFTSRLQLESARAHERSEKWSRTVAANGQLAGAFGLVNGISAQWEAFNRSHIGAAYSAGKRGSVIKAYARSVRIGSQIAIYGFGAWLVIGTEIAPGALVASAILLARALAPLEGLASSIRAIRSALAAYQRLKLLPEDADVPALTEGGAIKGDIQLHDVTYYYPTRKTPALRVQTLQLEAGQSLGIVGANGSGKSTLAALLAGAMSPTTGSASLDGLPIVKWQRGDCEAPIGYLADEPLLLEGSVHENIARFGQASLMSSAHAAMKAGVHETLQALQSGYDTPVGPQGNLLSLRERRAVAFARALAGNPKIAVLDEPETGLDGASMKRLMSILADLKASGTALVIATQDPRLLALVDKVVVLSGGSVQVMCDAADFAKTAAKTQPVAAGEPIARPA